MTPPHIQFKVQELFKAGMFAIITVALPGAQGVTVTGTHGMGVSTPKAAVVAAATVGLAKDEHMANGMIFTKGMLSIMLASGM
jgi:hypothetical protein